MLNDTPTGKTDSSEVRKRPPRTTMSEVILWTLQELKLLEEQLAPLGIFSLTENKIVNQRLALLPLLQQESVEVQQEACTFLVPQETLKYLMLQEKEKLASVQEFSEVSETELTDAMVHTLRKLQLLQDNLTEAEIFDSADNWLLDLETAVVELLQKPPEELQSQLRILRDQAKISRETSIDNGKHEGGNPSDLS